MNLSALRSRLSALRGVGAHNIHPHQQQPLLSSRLVESFGSSSGNSFSANSSLPAWRRGRLLAVGALTTAAGLTLLSSSSEANAQQQPAVSPVALGDPTGLGAYGEAPPYNTEVKEPDPQQHMQSRGVIPFSAAYEQHRSIRSVQVPDGLLLDLSRTVLARDRADQAPLLLSIGCILGLGSPDQPTGNVSLKTELHTATTYARSEFVPAALVTSGVIMRLPLTLQLQATPDSLNMVAQIDLNPTADSALTLKNEDWTAYDVSYFQEVTPQLHLGSSLTYVVPTEETILGGSLKYLSEPNSKRLQPLLQQLPPGAALPMLPAPEELLFTVTTDGRFTASYARQLSPIAQISSEFSRSMQGGPVTILGYKQRHIMGHRIIGAQASISTDYKVAGQGEYTTDTIKFVFGASVDHGQSDGGGPGGMQERSQKVGFALTMGF